MTSRPGKEAGNLPDLKSQFSAASDIRGPHPNLGLPLKGKPTLLGDAHPEITNKRVKQKGSPAYTKGQWTMHYNGS